MKTVEMDRDYDHQVNPQTTIAYVKGQTYTHVPNAHADAIVAAGAGRVTSEEADEPSEQHQAEGRRRARG